MKRTAGTPLIRTPWNEDTSINRTAGTHLVKNTIPLSLFLSNIKFHIHHIHMLQMVNLRMDPEGNNIFSTTNPSIPSIMGTESNQKLLDLTQRVKELESELERYMYQVHREREGRRKGRGRETEHIVTIDHMYIPSTCSREEVERMVSLPTPYRLPRPPWRIPVPLLEHLLKL